MGIQALPQSAVRAIGASQVLNEPAAVIKELLENALDARATSVTVEISSNTLDSIQVRDNGHGIPSEDRELVARPHCTSKIGSEGDLASVGGATLGFRGEALASVAEMSGSLTISTRVEGEEVAVALKIDQRGQVIGQERASLPIGTTVKITDFIKAHPVRRQVALKNTEKSLSKIKHCLQSYAFARPHVRLCLRILKSKNERGNWMYAPKPGGSVEDAAFKIVGAACASQCTWSVVEHEAFTLKAFLPRLDADVEKIGSIGPFLSIDTRPVAVRQGTAKQVVKMFKEMLKKANPKLEGVKDAFICLDISCPSESYDVNVEPAKDDVLFENPDIVIEAARRLFAAAYPAQEVQVSESDDHNQDVFSTPSDLVSSDAGLGLLSSDTLLEDMVRTTNKEPSFRYNMYGCDEEHVESVGQRPPTGRTEADFEELRRAKNDVSVSNPWIIAKLNAPMRHRPSEDAHEGDESNGFMVEEDRFTALRTSDRPPIDVGVPALPTPRPSSPLLSPRNSQAYDGTPGMRLNEDAHMTGPPLPPLPQTLERRNLLQERSERQQESEDGIQPPVRGFFLSAESISAPNGTPLHAIPEIGRGGSSNPAKKSQGRGFNRPFVSLLKSQVPREKVWFDHLEKQSNGKQRFNKKRRHEDMGTNDLVTSGEVRDPFEESRPLTPPRHNRDIRDFIASVDLSAAERILSPAESPLHSQQDRANALESTDLRSMPSGDTLLRSTDKRNFVPATEIAALENHLEGLRKEGSRSTKRRRRSETSALREVSGNAAIAVDETPDDRPTMSNRGLSSRRRTTDGTKVRRVKSSRIPLERVPAGQGMHNIVVHMSITTRAISSLAAEMDEYLKSLKFSGPAVEASENSMKDLEQGEVKKVAANLLELLQDRVSDGEMVQDLNMLVQNAFASHFEGSMNSKAV